MSKVTRQQIADAFAGAKQYLWNGVGGYGVPYGKVSYICIAVDKVTSVHPEARRKAICEIEKRLGPYCQTVVEWLRERGYLKELRPGYEWDVQQYRHRWLDALVAEFSRNP